MAEDQGKKEEEKFEFTPEGEALGYISLEQARVVAMQTARDEPGDYGRRLSGVQMVWEVISSEEGEDYYQIRLSYRPAGRFRGRPGLEQFIIDKSGDIRIRQILDEPSSRKPIRTLVLMTVGLVAVAIAASVALFSIKVSVENQRVEVYTEIEEYTVQEPFTEVEEYTEREPYTV